MDAITLPLPGRRRRSYSQEFKAQIVETCNRPGTSVAAIAQQHNINDNIVHRWIGEAEQAACRACPVLRCPSASRRTGSAPLLRLPSGRSGSHRWRHGGPRLAGLGARRKFLDLDQGTPKGRPVAAEILGQIARLYEIEAQGREYSRAGRQALRQEHTRPALQHLHDRCCR